MATALNAPDRQPLPTILGVDNRPLVTFTDTGSDGSLLEGFHITHSHGPSGGAIVCQTSSPTIVHCLIVGHNTYQTQAPVVLCQQSRAVLRYCTVADNATPTFVPILHLINSPVTLSHTIVWNQGGPNFLSDMNPAPVTDHCNIAGYPSPLDTDPLFAQPGQWLHSETGEAADESSMADAVWVPGDYHLLSVAGRWFPTERRWQLDTVTSPCIDTGDPNAAWGQETVPHGDRVNLGVYGGTIRASKSYVANIPVHFESLDLKWAVEDALGIFDPTPADMLGLTSIRFKGLEKHARINSLVGLEYAINMTKLVITDCRFPDLVPIADLMNLEYLDISDGITFHNIAGLVGLQNLEHLDMHNNHIWSLHFIKKLVKLKKLIIRRNSLWNDLDEIRDLPALELLDVRSNKLTELDALTDMTTLKELYLDGNPWNPTDFDTNLDIIRKNNRGIMISH